MNKQRLIEKRILAQHRIIADRLRENPEEVLSFASGNLQRWAHRYHEEEQPYWMKEWRQLLSSPTEVITQMLTSSSEEAKRLRSSSPFAGILSPHERWVLYRELQDET